MARGGSGLILLLPLSILESRSVLFHVLGESSYPGWLDSESICLSAPGHAGSEKMGWRVGGVQGGGRKLQGLVLTGTETEEASKDDERRGPTSVLRIN